MLLGLEKSGFSIFGGHPELSDETQFDTAARECSEELCGVLGSAMDIKVKYLLPLEASGCELWDGSYAVCLGVLTQRERDMFVEKFHNNRWENGLGRALCACEMEKENILWFQAELIYRSCLMETEACMALEKMFSSHSWQLRPFFRNFMKQLGQQCEIDGCTESQRAWRAFCLHNAPFPRYCETTTIKQRPVPVPALTDINFHTALTEMALMLVRYYREDRNQLAALRQNQVSFPFEFLGISPSYPVPFYCQLACILAESLVTFKTMESLQIYVIIPLYKETIRVKQAGENPAAEDLVRRKVAELSLLLDQQPLERRSHGFLFFVDDQCPDNSGGAVEAVIAQLSLPPYLSARVFRRPMTFGGRESRKAGAVRYGLWRAVQEAKSQAVFVLSDADLSANLLQIGLLIEPLVTQKVQLVVGSRRLPNSLIEKKGNANGSRLLSLLRRLVFPALRHLTDTQVGFKALSMKGALTLCGLTKRRKGKGVSAKLDLKALNAKDMSIGFDIDVIMETQIAFPNEIKEVAIGWVDSEEESNVWRIGKAITFHQVVISLASACRRHCPSCDNFSLVNFIDQLSVEELDRLLFHFESVPLEPKVQDLIALSRRPRFELASYQTTKQCFYADLDPDAICSARKRGECCPLTLPAALSAKGVFISPRAVPRKLAASSILSNMTRHFDCRRFSRENDLPVHVGYLSDYAAFDRPGCPQPQNMPIKFPNSDYRLPQELAQFEELVQMVADFWHSVHPSPEDYYCYLSLSQSVVPSGCWQRRPHLHSDGFQSAWIKKKLPCDMSFTVSNVRPTLYYQQRFPTEHLDPARDNFFKDFEKKLVCAPIDCQAPYQVTMMDAYTLHRANKNTSPDPVARTFVRMIFSVWKWDRSGNAHNPMFDYNWPPIERENWANLK